MPENTALRDLMAAQGLKQHELADTINRRLLAAGRRPTVTDRTVRYWLTGRAQWPKAHLRRALEEEFACPIEHLGFVRPSWARPDQPEDDAVLRRDFLAGSAATTAAAAVPDLAGARTRRIGISDVERLHGRLAELIARDHRQGGSQALETQALAMAGQAIALQERGSTSQRVRKALYATAAGFTSSAMWAAIDGCRFNAAQQHFDRAASLAAMSGDSAITFRIWSHAGSMYRHLGRPADAAAANDVARQLPIARRDPLFASLGHARHAAILGLTRDRPAVQRALRAAEDAYHRADTDTPRPVWLTAFYDRAELNGLALSAYLGLGRYDQAEAHAHACLTALRTHLQRSHAITTARLAHAQLGQGDVDPAVHTATSLLHDQQACRHPRVARMLTTFTRQLRATAPDAAATREWQDRLRDHTAGSDR